MQIENMQNFILFVHLVSYLVSFIAFSFVKFTSNSHLHGKLNWK